MAQNLDTTVDKLGDRIAELVERLEKLYGEAKARIHRLLIGANGGGLVATLTVINSVMPEPGRPRIGLGVFVVLLVFVAGLTCATLQAFMEHKKIVDGLASGRKSLLALRAALQGSRGLQTIEEIPEENRIQYEEWEEILQDGAKKVLEKLELASPEGLSKSTDTIFTVLAGGCFVVGGILGLALLYDLGF